MAGDIPETKYEVSAFLRLKGDFEARMTRASKKASTLHRGLARLSSMAERVSGKMGGATSGMARQAKVLAVIAGGAGAAGMATLAKGGFAFADEMERSQLSIATMFQLFGQAEGALGKNIGAAKSWDIHLRLAERTMKRFMILQRETPAGAADLVEIYKSAASGLAQTGVSLSKQEAVVTKLSMLGPNMRNDFGQIGRDMSMMMRGLGGSDVQTFSLMTKPLREAAKLMPDINKKLTTAGKFTEEWNKKLTAKQRFDVFEKAISVFGPAMNKTFKESMDGLKSTTRSNMQVLAMSFATPLRDGYKKFLSDANDDSSAIFGKKAFANWVEVLGKAGGFFSKSADKIYKKIFDAAKFIGENADEIGRNIKSAFAFGVLLLKGMLAKALFSAVAGPALGLAGKLRGAANGKSIRETLGGAATAFGEKRRGVHARMARGFVGGQGGGAGGMFGRGVRKLVGDKGSNNLRNVGAPILRITSLLATLGSVISPVLLLLVPLVLVFGFIGVAFAGMAVYFIENWDKISSSITDNMESIKPAIKAVVTAGYRLWYGLVAIGEQFIGGKSGADLMTTALKAMEWIIGKVTGAVSFFLKVGSSIQFVVGVLQDVFGVLFQMMADVAGWVPGMASTQEAMKMMSEAFSATADESYQSGRNLEKLAAKFDEFSTKELTAEQKSKIDKKTEDMSKLLARAAGPRKGKKVPTSGMYVNNMYNAWDLREQDPDRLMAAFLPKLEKLTDKRVQGFDVLTQGV